MNSLRHAEMKTMNPADRFVTPRPAPPVPAPVARLGSAPHPLRHIRSARSLSPSPSSWPWSPRRIFSRRTRGDSEADQHSDDDNTRPPSPADDSRSATFSQGSRSRSISPESLRRFLVDDDPMVEEPAEMGDRPSVSIPDDIAEENEDDENFATSAASESMLYTGLSPPPLQRGASSTTVLGLSPTASPADADAEEAPEAPTRPPPGLPVLQVPEPETDMPPSHFSVSSASSLPSPASPASPSHDLPSFYHSESEDDEAAAAKDLDDDAFPFPTLDAFAPPPGAPFGQSLLSAFAGYSLPPSSLTADARKAPLLHAVGSPALIARGDADLPVGNTALLAGPPSSGLDELVSDLGWMSDLIKHA